MDQNLCTAKVADIDAAAYVDADAAVTKLIKTAALSTHDRQTIATMATDLVVSARANGTPGLMEVFLAEYGLSTHEGVALMCLAEALLRVPDAKTIDALIEDKIAPSDWGRHLGHSTSSLVNASTWALMLTGRILEDSPPGPIGHLRNAIKRLGEPVIRAAVARAMKEMGRQFVLGETIETAMQRAEITESKGFSYSYDMLGEAALTEADARAYFDSYEAAITAISNRCIHPDIRLNPGISIKLSALHPRYARAQDVDVLNRLVPRVHALAKMARDAGMGLNVDAEEADRLSLSLQVIDAVLAQPDLAGWDGFGIVVQAYSPRASVVIDTIYDLACRYNRKLMVRLVKGAYWDTEIKRAQVAGVAGFPVFTRKAATDISYIANARTLLRYSDRLYPQFATHNAHTVAAILHMADGETFEFQRLHGMGETLHALVQKQLDTRCRIYAPVGAHKDLLAYLVRRLLENGANSSFVNQIVDMEVPPHVVAADPFDAFEGSAVSLRDGPALFAPDRRNARGFDLAHLPTLHDIDAARVPFRTQLFTARSLTVSQYNQPARDIRSPADTQDSVGQVQEAPNTAAKQVLSDARQWSAPLSERRAVLERASDLYEAHFGEIFALLAREAGKTLPDAVAELREAVDFLRYYAQQTEDHTPLGTVLCISPWNFPLAIFTGQVAAALATGNAVIAKPAPQTPLIAHLAVRLLHSAGVPASALQLVLGDGAVGAALTAAAPNGVVFTGSTTTGLRIRKTLAEYAAPDTPLIAETGGLNAMIVDSTALLEQAVQSIIESAFQSAGQRCSALRCLYVQDDIAPAFLEMLTGAMDSLRLGDPWHLKTDIGPVIDAPSRARIMAHIDAARAQGRVLHTLPCPAGGTFVPPTLIRVSGIGDLDQEVFGPVLHVATFASQELDQVIDDINATGYGLTFGLHTRIDDRVAHVTDRIAAGNIYVNRNQIGAIVGSQPFGGTGLSGTGPKAGGPDYLLRFSARAQAPSSGSWTENAPLPEQPVSTPTPVATIDLPGPTGESNRLSHLVGPALLCAGPGADAAAAQANAVEALGGQAAQSQGAFDPRALTKGPAYGGVLWWGDSDTAKAMAQALAARTGPITPLICGYPNRADVMLEKHLCIDTTAAGGNAALLGQFS